jgi:beta-alanine--pyruvate transaminase
MSMTISPPRNSMEPFWLPFTANRAFKAAPRLFSGAEGMHYITPDGRRILDTIAGLWCVNAGHAQRPIIDAIKAQAEQLDFVSSFQMSHPSAFELAGRLTALAPPGIEHVFFTNSGSESVDTALKIARGYHRARGHAERIKLIGRAKSYHGVGIGGLSVAGIPRHKLPFGPLLADVDHLALPYNPKVSAFSRGQPEAGADYAEELAALIALHDPSTIAAVIVEPITGSGGVYPPPKGYLERLRALCTQHGILLIFDEVITGFGRVGAAFGSERLGVTPDIITCAKGMTNGAVPMGGVLVSGEVYQAYMGGPDGQIELPHGYTYSAHPLACAAALATLDVYRDQGLFERAAEIEGFWEEALHSLKDARHVVDIRNIGVLGAVELASRGGAPGARGAEVNRFGFEQKDMLLRNAGDILLFSPPLIISRAEIERVVDAIRAALATID